MKTLTQHEILHLDKSSPLLIQVVGLPRDEFLLCYFDEQTAFPKFYLWSQENAQWTVENLQNKSNLTAILPYPARIEAAFLGFDNKGDLLLFFNQCNEENNWDLFLVESTNYAKSWSTLRRISPDFQSWRVIAPPYILQYGPHLGHLLLPVEDKMTTGKLILISENNGTTWAPSLYLDVEDEEPDETTPHSSLSTDQNRIMNMRIIDFPKGEIAIIYTRNKIDGLWQEISLDGGYTWQSPEQLKISPTISSDIIDIIMDSTELNQPKTFLMGLYRKEMIWKLGVWMRESQEIKFRLIWDSPELGSIAVDWCQLLIDYQKNFHIFYQIGSTLHHFWDSLQKM